MTDALPFLVGLLAGALATTLHHAIRGDAALAHACTLRDNALARAERQRATIERLQAERTDAERTIAALVIAIDAAVEEQGATRAPVRVGDDVRSRFCWN